MSRRHNEDCLDSTSHVAHDKQNQRNARRRGTPQQTATSSSSSVCGRSPQRKSKNLIRWTRRGPPPLLGRHHSSRDLMTSPLANKPQNLGEILNLVGTGRTTKDDARSLNASQLFQQHQQTWHGSSRSVLSVGSRVSFAKELEEVIDIPEYDNEDRPKCFYSNRDLNEFRCEWEMEQDGLIPIQR